MILLQNLLEQLSGNNNILQMYKLYELMIELLLNGNKNIVGVMIESHINAGNQKLNNPADLDYGVSITDACVDWNTTEKILLDAHKKLSK